ncbi:hypothetical protein BDV40DRAFT_307108 [Aspergillus tamarii]|uniref:Uncharacterized protein n=1 Tax=Aspergillus tamarii TaxID=41984 RepID=A0A5N6U9V3_ASPTM|nr:hypothetical protein BDV40DRAFT_307108 [Aspergillus tamarii]
MLYRQQSLPIQNVYQIIPKQAKLVIVMLLITRIILLHQLILEKFLMISSIQKHK